ncbi:ATP-dependent protease ATPase subunit HslU [Corallococcus sp. BB11-1]|uniref:ATP-dependent protease ATPase subunit HslU n=1 Tax=Corallococcus sp. BB11-1 TaxID=2996783 RepID=UPI00226F0785|nr:ATP-dependent protease ATPase subunit HslU [Corallococcus sp. BB11-1]MCY1035507.1 ATP-dependent protease ATPase subunit HslU [Corallococcus sp. BB11-1]
MAEPRKLSAFTPREVVSELDRYIVGQNDAKRAVAIALRNRWRRQQVSDDLRDEIHPKNIIMIGPTGVGKTEIARRLAKLSQAPFVKVEASKFTEVGYVGRDVESMIRDLVEAAIALVREEETEKVKPRAEELAEDRLMELIKNGGASRPAASPPFGFTPPPPSAPSPLGDSEREKLRAQLRAGTLDDQQVEVETSESSPTFMRNFSGQGMEEIGVNLQDLFKNMPGMKNTRKRRVRVPEALQMLRAEEAQKLVDPERVQREAVLRAESSGIVFIDEIDKIASREGGKGGGGPDVSREGVQRDILPIVEGSSVNTKYGQVKTDHMLFIAAGAFHVSKPSDLIPELQGRFPIRVELEALSGEDLVRILREPKNSLLRQYTALLATEGVRLTFTDDAVSELARIAQQANDRTQNIGARRLHTVLERLLDDVSFTASELGPRDFQVDGAYVRERLSAIVQDEDLSRYIL